MPATGKPRFSSPPERLPGRAWASGLRYVQRARAGRTSRTDRPVPRSRSRRGIGTGNLAGLNPVLVLALAVGGVVRRRGSSYRWRLGAVGTTVYGSRYQRASSAWLGGLPCPVFPGLSVNVDHLMVGPCVHLVDSKYRRGAVRFGVRCGCIRIGKTGDPLLIRSAKYEAEAVFVHARSSYACGSCPRRPCAVVAFPGWREFTASGYRSCRPLRWCRGYALGAFVCSRRSRWLGWPRWYGNGFPRTPDGDRFGSESVSLGGRVGRLHHEHDRGPYRVTRYGPRFLRGGAGSLPAPGSCYPVMTRTLNARRISTNSALLVGPDG